MTTKLRYARWAAVSTPKQAAEDKVSISVQLDGGAEFGRHYGLEEASNSPYVVPGETRTAWVNLRDAERAIPALGAMLDAAGRGEFDVLYVYDLNRFRDLMRPVFDVLSDYGVQIYVSAYPRDPVSRQEYTSERMQEASMIVDLAGMMSRNEVSSLRRHYQTKMPRRITEKGLHSNIGKPPYGYRRPLGQEYNHDCILEPDPVLYPILLRLKDEFLAGKSFATIAKRLNEDGIPSAYGKQWYSSAVEQILTNPFYSGVVRFGYRKTVRDRRTGTSKRVVRDPVTAPGKHQPAWDEHTYQKIVYEVKTRTRQYPGRRITPLSGLLTCAYCGGTMWRSTGQGNKSVNTPRAHHYWYCAAFAKTADGHRVKHSSKGHAAIEEERCYDMFIAALLTALDAYQAAGVAPASDERPLLQKELQELQARRGRWLDAYETGSMPADDAQGRIKAIDDSISLVRRKLDQLTARLTSKQAGQERLQELAKARTKLPDYIMRGDPAQVNQDLRDILEKVLVRADKTVAVTLKR